MFNLRKGIIKALLQVIPLRDPRKVLKGAHALPVKGEDGKVRVEACDGHILLQVDIDGEVTNPGIMPDGLLRFVCGLLRKRNDVLECDTNALAVTKHGDTTVTRALVQGTFPKIDLCWPKNYKEHTPLYLDVHLLKRAAIALAEIAETNPKQDVALYIGEPDECIVFEGELGPMCAKVRMGLMPIKVTDIYADPDDEPVADDRRPVSDDKPVADDRRPVSDDKPSPDDDKPLPDART